MLTLVERQPRTNPVSWNPVSWNPVSWNKVTRLCRRAGVLVAARRSRARQLDALSRLDDRLLADIGLTREAQIVECSKLFWWFP